MKRIIFTVSIVVITLGLFVFMTSSKEKPKKPPQKPVVKMFNTQTIESTQPQVEIQVRGRIESRQKFMITSEVAGLVQSSHFKLRPGSYVPKGSTIFQVDSRNVSLQVKILRSQLLTLLTQFIPEFRSQFPEQVTHWEQYFQSLTQGQYPELPQAQEAREEMLVHSMGIAAKHYALHQQLVVLSQHRVRAPFSGSVVSATVNPGARVNPGQNLGVFVGNQQYEMTVDIPISMADHLKKNSPVNIQVDGIPEALEGKLVRVARAVQEGTQSIPAAVSVQAPRGVILDGRYGVASLNSIPLDSVFAIPSEAMLGFDKVLLIQDGQLVDRSAQVVLRSQDSTYISMQGFQAGEVVVSELFQEYVPGMKAQSRDR